MSKKTSTHKLGEIKDQPHPGGPFHPMRLRMPGWHPDADDKSALGNQREELFLEEAIEYRAGKFHPFPVPNSRSPGQAFEEPSDTSESNPEGWIEFNKWILGRDMPPATDTSHMSQLIRKLAEHVRAYNFTLYRLRRLHYYTYAQKTDLPPPAPGEADIPDTADPQNDPTFKQIVDAARLAYENAVCKIDSFIDCCSHPEFGGLKIIAADMTEVNNYIVSMRVVADTEQAIKDRARPYEVGGSSSHVSINSPFCSSCSP